MGLLRDKLQTMDGKAVLLAMIEGLENPAYRVAMSTFGSVRDRVCVACAATNAITKMTGVIFDENNIWDTEFRAMAVVESVEFQCSFEAALDSLRRGYVEDYNRSVVNLALDHLRLPAPKMLLPVLETSNYPSYLQYYKDYAAQI